MKWSDTITSEPAVEPVTFADMQSFSRITTDHEQALIEGMIVAARRYAESFTRRALITQTHVLRMDEWPSNYLIELPSPPLQSVTSLKYIDSEGNQQTVSASDYDVDIYSLYGRIEPAYGVSWPSPRSVMNAIEVTYVCGYGDAATDVPQPIKTAIMMLVAHWYEFREPVVAGTNVASVPMHVEMVLRSTTAARFL